MDGIVVQLQALELLILLVKQLCASGNVTGGAGGVGHSDDRCVFMCFFMCLWFTTRYTCLVETYTQCSYNFRFADIILSFSILNTYTVCCSTRLPSFAQWSVTMYGQKLLS